MTRGAPTDGWRFRHELLREVAAELAPPSVRRALHAKVADALTGGGDPDWQLVAAHYEQTERADEAAAAYQQASADARRRGALVEARSYLNQALVQLDRCTPGPERDRCEMTTRLQHGFLVTATEGLQSRDAAIDFERCLQLGGNDLRDDELVSTLVCVAWLLLATRRLAPVSPGDRVAAQRLGTAAVDPSDGRGGIGGAGLVPRPFR